MAKSKGGRPKLPEGKSGPPAGRAKFGKRGGRGNGLTIPEKEAIYQAYLALGSKAEAARSLGVSYSTVQFVIKAIEASAEPTALAAAKEKMSLHLAGRFHESTNQILDSIKPEDLESGRIPVYDAKGNLKGYTYFGPSLVAKATAAGIFTDKIRMQQEFVRALAADQSTGKMLMPEGAEQLIAAIRDKVSSISVLNVQFRQDNPDLTTRLDKAMEVVAAEMPTEPSNDPDRFPFDN